MKNTEWKYFDDVDLEDIEYVEKKKTKKLAKRKWREIENFKEKQRLTRDLEGLHTYNL